MKTLIASVLIATMPYTANADSSGLPSNLTLPFQGALVDTQIQNALDEHVSTINATKICSTVTYYREKMECTIAFKYCEIISTFIRDVATNNHANRNFGFVEGMWRECIKKLTPALGSRDKAVGVANAYIETGIGMAFGPIEGRKVYVDNWLNTHSK